MPCVQQTCVCAVMRHQMIYHSPGYIWLLSELPISPVNLHNFTLFDSYINVPTITLFKNVSSKKGQIFLILEQANVCHPKWDKSVSSKKGQICVIIEKANVCHPKWDKRVSSKKGQIFLILEQAKVYHPKQNKCVLSSNVKCMSSCKGQMYVILQESNVCHPRTTKRLSS